MNNARRTAHLHLATLFIRIKAEDFPRISRIDANPAGDAVDLRGLVSGTVQWLPRLEISQGLSFAVIRVICGLGNRHRLVAKGEIRGGDLVQGVNNDKEDAGFVTGQNLMEVIVQLCASIGTTFRAGRRSAWWATRRLAPVTAPEIVLLAFDHLPAMFFPPHGLGPGRVPHA